MVLRNRSVDRSRPEAVIQRGRGRAGRSLRGQLLLLGVSGALLVAGCGGDGGGDKKAAGGDGGGDKKAAGGDGGGDKKAACATIQTELQQGADPQQVNDPASAVPKFRARAAKIRSAGDSSGDSEVKAAAGRLATNLDAIADAVEEARSGGTPQFPNVDPRKSGLDLKKACA